MKKTAKTNKKEVNWNDSYNFNFDNYVESILEDRGVDNWLKLDYTDIVVAEKEARKRADYDVNAGEKGAWQKNADAFYKELSACGGDMDKISDELWSIIMP